jgi:multicomponent Na+:H+ antiporter subunit B
MRWRRWIVLACAAAIAAAVVPALVQLPSSYRGPYGDAVVPVSLAERHATNVAGTVAYDVRGFDTLGEELILFGAVIGVGVLLRPRNEAHREARGVDRATPAGRGEAESRPGARRASTNVMAIAIVFGSYMSLHATQTPGGGFQGGAILASALALVYLGAGYGAWARFVAEPAYDVGEVAGVWWFAWIAALPVALAEPLVTNWLPLRKTGAFGSGGTMFAINIGIAVAVAAGFALILGALLYELHEDIDELAEDARAEAA